MDVKAILWIAYFALTHNFNFDSLALHAIFWVIDQLMNQIYNSPEAISLDFK